MIDDELLKALKELLKDAEACARLSQWEQEFCSDFATRVATYGADIRISDKQDEVLRRIEAKVYA